MIDPVCPPVSQPATLFHHTLGNPSSSKGLIYPLILLHVIWKVQLRKQIELPVFTCNLEFLFNTIDFCYHFIRTVKVLLLLHLKFHLPKENPCCYNNNPSGRHMSVFGLTDDDSFGRCRLLSNRMDLARRRKSASTKEMDEVKPLKHSLQQFCLTCYQSLC